MSEPFDIAATATGDTSTKLDKTASELSLLDIAVVFSENMKLLVLAPLAAGALAFAATYLVKPVFTSTTSIVVPQQQQGLSMALLGQLSGLASSVGGLAGLKNPADQWVGLLKSRTVADALVQEYALRERYDLKYRFEAREALADKTTILSGKDGLITISVDDIDPEVAAKMAASYVSELRKLSSGMSLTEAAQRRAFFERQLKETKDNLTKAETVLQQSGLGEGALKTRPEAAVELLAQLKAQIVALEVKIPVMRGYLAPESPVLKQAQAELAELRRQQAKYEQDRAATAGDGSDYVARYRDFKYYETLYELMARQYELARIDEANEGMVIQTVDVAQVPEWKSKPKRAVIAVAAAAATFFGVWLVILTRNALRGIEANPERAPKLARVMHNLPFGGRRRQPRVAPQ